MTTEHSPDFAVDITNCDREPIHVLGAIQPFGVLIAVSADWIVARVSANTLEQIGVAPSDLLGQPVARFILPEALHAIRNRVAMLRGADAVERLFSVDLIAGRPAFDIAVHFSGSVVVIEAEPARGDEIEVASLVRSMVGRQAAAESTSAFYREGARQVRALTGFDRVMVYRFDAAGSGEVVAEALRPGVDSFLGLNYPASDIPAQARALYLRSVFRIIADVNAAPATITPRLNGAGEALDQSLSVLRAVSPIHIEYLKNMGVAASLSISIIVGGRLWGLFACHHYEPRLPSFAQRSASELFGQMFSMMLESRERQEAGEYEGRARAVADRLMAAAAQDNALLGNADWLGEVIFDAVPADGVGVLVDGQTALSGLTPSKPEFLAITATLNRLAASQVFTTDQISSLLPEAERYANRAAGLLAIPISRAPRDYVVLFRSEKLRSVRWAGNQEKAIEYGPNGPRLTPRKSFEEWSELVKGKAAPFTDAEKRVAEALRTALLEVVLRLSENVWEERQRAHQQQELLIAELNHRVRNILALIRGLVAQSRRTSLTAEDFVATLDNRIQALARAHDQITADRWGPARLKDLIETESAAYLGDRRGRIGLTGPNVLIDPTSFTVLALVIHELLTNAAKYGALADSRGEVAIAWRIDDAGSLNLSWRESGGPAVTAPSRRGFGSTIIERSIPYDLGGSAVSHYRLSGFEADFVIPAKFVVSVLPETAKPKPSAAPVPAVVQPLAGRTILLVEDSMIVALDSEDTLRELGAKSVLVAASCQQALAVLAESAIDFAILDFNLGSETSLPVAEALMASGVSFVFATGYGDSLDLDSRFDDVGVVKKPYVGADIVAAISGEGRADIWQ
ncbi:MAG TPA: HWE histidine kinase domain-containing protein [Caulobacteraceae bacterium]|nr:HWE histidine kinase domain-containing protein [Caulobacteraceae bacterium]